MSQILDVVDINNIGIIRPELQTDYHTVEQTDVQEIIGLELSSMAQEVYNGQNDPAKNNMLLINTKANNMAIDQRLLIPQAPPSNKIPEVIKQVIIDYAESTPVSGTQLIFLDTGVYGGNTFDLYSEIKNDLIKKGIPESEIAFAQQAKNEKQLEEIFEGVRHGKIRVLMGSTAKMGEGVEVQNKGYSLHHIDIGIRPDIVRQRDGRLQRQGNENKTVKRHIYITKGSSDTRNAKIVDRKAQIIDAVLMGNVTEREFEEQRDMTAADIMSLSTGNDAIQRKIELDAQLSELESLRFVHNRKVLHARQQITSLEKKVGITGQVLSFYEQLSDYLSSNTHPVFSINGEVYKNKFFMSKLNTELKSKGVAYFELYGLKCEYTMYLSITNELTPLFKLPATSLNDELDADTSVSRESILKLKNAIDVKKLDELIIEIKHAQKADDHSLSEFHKLIQNPEFSNSSKLQELQKQQIELTLEVQEASRLKEAAWTGPKTIAEWAEKNGVIIESEKSSQTNLQMKM